MALLHCHSALTCVDADCSAIGDSYETRTAAAESLCSAPTCACEYAESSLVQHFSCRFKKTSKKIPGKSGQRYWKNVGLGFKTPREAIEGALLLQTLTHHAQSPWAPMPAELWQGGGSPLDVIQALLGMSKAALALQAHTLTRSAHSPAMSPSGGVSYQVQPSCSSWLLEAPHWQCTPSVLVTCLSRVVSKGSGAFLDDSLCRYRQIDKDDQDNHCQKELCPLHQEICQASSICSHHDGLFPAVHFVFMLSKVLASTGR